MKWWILDPKSYIVNCVGTKYEILTISMELTKKSVDPSYLLPKW